jgi:hypothetical protein
MQTQLKCSSCGAEISNLNFSWGKWQWLSMIPLFALMLTTPFLMRYWMHDDHDFRKDLVVRDIEKRYIDGKLEILGSVQNSGDVHWNNVLIEVEMYDGENRFIDELTHNIGADIAPHGLEHFKLSNKDVLPSEWEIIQDVKVKVANAYHFRY